MKQKEAKEPLVAPLGPPPGIKPDFIEHGDLEGYLIFFSEAEMKVLLTAAKGKKKSIPAIVRECVLATLQP